MRDVFSNFLSINISTILKKSPELLSQELERVFLLAQSRQRLVADAEVTSQLATVLQSIKQVNLLRCVLTRTAFGAELG